MVSDTAAERRLRSRERTVARIGEDALREIERFRVQRTRAKQNRDEVNRHRRATAAAERQLRERHPDEFAELYRAALRD